MEIMAQGVVNASAADIFARLVSPDFMKAASDTIESVTVSPDPPALGSVYTMKTKVMGTVYESKTEITTFEQDKAFGMTTVMPNPTTMLYTLEDSGGGVNVTYKMILSDSGFPAAAAATIKQSSEQQAQMAIQGLQKQFG